MQLGYSSACGLCLTSLHIFDEKNAQNGVVPEGINAAHFLYGNIEYHATCANFWVNCVDQELPKLNSNFILSNVSSDI